MSSRPSKHMKLKLNPRTPSPDSDKADSAPVKVLFWNTQLAAPGFAHKAKTSYFTVLDSPTKVERDPDTIQWNEEAATTPCSRSHPLDLSEYLFLDPAYIRQCEMDDTDHKRCRRTVASVSFITI